MEDLKIKKMYSSVHKHEGEGITIENNIEKIKWVWYILFEYNKYNKLNLKEVLLWKER